MDRQACPSGQEAHRGRTIGAEEVARHWVMCRGCDKEDGTDKHRVDCCPSWTEARDEIPEQFRKKTMKEKHQAEDGSVL